MNLLTLECAIARYFDYRQNVIIPNVSWGMGLKYEADMIIISMARYCTEIELKISRADLKRDSNKKKWCLTSPEWSSLNYNIIRRQFFGLPESFCDIIKHIPSQCGVLLVSESGKVHLERTAKLNRARPLAEKEYLHALHLVSMRLWTLKEVLLKKINDKLSSLSARKDGYDC